MEQGYYNLGGTIRSCPLEATLKHLHSHFNYLGITRVANITGLDCIGIPSAICIRPNAKHLSVSQGKGITLELAMASAIMESIETYHAENPPTITCQGSYAELKKSLPVVSPCLFNPGFFLMPHLENVSLSWVEAIDLSNQNKVLIPHILSNLNSTEQHSEYGYLQVSTNGLAAGNTQEEAICHALYEVIERDSLSRWSMLSEAERQLTRVSPNTIDSPINQNLIEKYHTANIQIKIWNITSSIGVPTFHCAIRGTNALQTQNIFRGTGTHLCKEIALARALMEAAQSRVGVISGTRDDIFSDQYKKFFSGTFISKDDKEEASFSDYQTYSFSHSFHENISQISALLCKNGFNQVLMVSHTKQELNIPVVQIFIPGLSFNSARI